MKNFFSKKVIVSLVAFVVLLISGVGAYLIWGKQEPPPPEPEPITDKQVSVKDIKEKYGYKDNKISPLYNVSPTEQFKISFNSYLGDKPAPDIITVHTHSSLSTSSIIDIELVPETHDVGPSTFTIVPKESVLPNGKDAWGSHHMYYIRINYDLDANVPTRLEEPIVIPFTIKGEAENVDAIPVITSNGEFQLTWKPLDKDSTSVQVFNIIKNVTTTYETDKTPIEADAFVSTYIRNIGGNSKGVFTDWLSKNLSSGVAVVPTSPNFTLNEGLKGAYFLRNANGGVMSTASNIVNVSEYANRIPIRLITPIHESIHATIRSLPKTVQVEMLDGSITDQFIKYQTEGVQIVADKPTKIWFTINNTPYQGYVMVENMTQVELEAIKKGELVNLSASYQKPLNLTSTKPSIYVPTLISDAEILVKEQEESEAQLEDEKTKENTNSVDSNSSEKQASSDKKEDSVSQEASNTGKNSEEGALSLVGGTSEKSDVETDGDDDGDLGLINKQYHYNRQVLETANEKTITVPAYIQEWGYELTHATALEEYLAYSLLAQEESVSLEAFPDAQTYEAITDAVEKVVTQNPLINNVKEWQYDYLTRTVKFTYDSSFSPSELLRKANEIIENLTMEDAVLSEKEKKAGVQPYKVKKDMTTYDVHQVIYDYLVANVKLTTVEEQKAKTDDKTVLEKKDEDTEKVAEEKQDEEVQAPSNATAYNALVEGLSNDFGVAKAYKLLLDMVGIPAITVTGYYHGEPHVWNKVELDGKWYNVDVTLNVDTLGVPHGLYLATDETATLLGYIPDKGYWSDNYLDYFKAESADLDPYKVNGLEVDTIGEYAEVLEKELSSGKLAVIIRTTLELDPKLVYDTTGLVVQQTVPDKLATATFNTKGKYFIIITEEVNNSAEDDNPGESNEVNEENTKQIEN